MTELNWLLTMELGGMPKFLSDKEREKREKRDDGILAEFYPYRGSPYFRNYAYGPNLKDAVRHYAVTAEDAAEMIGVNIRHFKRIISKADYVIRTQGVIKIGNFTFYDKNLMDLLAKKHHVGRIILALKRGNISNHRKKLLTEKLERKKLEYWLKRVGRSPETTVDELIDHMEKNPKFKEIVDAYLFQHFSKTQYELSRD